MSSNVSLYRVNELLVKQLEKVCDGDLKGEGLKEEINRGESVRNIAQVAVNNAALILKANLAVCNNQGDFEMPGIIDPARRAIEDKRRDVA